MALPLTRSRQAGLKSRPMGPEFEHALFAGLEAQPRQHPIAQFGGRESAGLRRPRECLGGRLANVLELGPIADCQRIHRQEGRVRRQQGHGLDGVFSEFSTRGFRPLGDPGREDRHDAIIAQQPGERQRPPLLGLQGRAQVPVQHRQRKVTASRPVHQGIDQRSLGVRGDFFFA